MRPKPRLTMPGTTRLVSSVNARTFRFAMLTSASVRLAENGPTSMTPALLTRMPMWPSASAALTTAAGPVGFARSWTIVRTST
jgi:hypothetical protein